jgi:hypothetical protein
MNKKNSGLAINLMMVITSFGLMQWHSIQFWNSAAGPSGWAWSIGLEIAMLCLWYDRKHRFLKYIAALILIAGPWYQMTSPAVRNIQNTNAIETEIEIETQRVDQLSKSMTIYENNSITIRGWAGRIDRTQKAKDELSARINKLHTELSKQNSTWREYMVTGVQSAALMIILIAQLSAVSNLGIRQTTVRTNPEPTIHTTSKSKRPAAEISKVTTKFLDEISTSNFEDFDRTVEIAATEIISELSKHNSQKALAQTLGIDQKSISLILNHKKRKLSGTERISSNALNKVLKALEIHRQSSPE